jgi:hypothetical protein
MINALAWLPAYLRQPRWRPANQGVTDIMLCSCDHFDPFCGADKAEALVRLRKWKQQWPDLIQPYRDADNCRPKHTFFYPVARYDQDIVNELTEICRLSGAEVEVLLHHDGATTGGLRDQLERGKAALIQHGLLGRDKAGNVSYGLIQGRGALVNSHARPKSGAVSEVLSVLQETGCYADFTQPSAPGFAQAGTINSLYYVNISKPDGPMAGRPACVGSRSLFPERAHEPELLLVQGPAGLNWKLHKYGFLPRIENSEISGSNPPRLDRMKVWLRLGIHVQAKPDWLFIKLHTRSGAERSMRTLLEDPMRRFYEEALMNYKDNKKFRLHFVTPRELVNIIHAAEDGQSGNAGAFRDYCFSPPALLEELVR